MKCVVKNGFHGTQVTIDTVPFSRLSDAQVARARKELCGMKDCSCDPFAYYADDTEYVIRYDSSSYPRRYYVEPAIHE